MSKSKIPESGADGFSNAYWEENYSELTSMDGIVNAKQHARYVKALMALETIDVSSIIDFGFGLGYMLKEFIQVFKPYRVMGIEPSETAFQKVQKKKLTDIESMNIKLVNTDLYQWAKKTAPKQKSFDLGICTSVFQYLEDEEMEVVLEAMSKTVKYLYFSVPTDKELKRQRSELDFHDRFAISRSKNYYHKLLKGRFTIVSNRLLESNYFIDEDDSPFSDYLFRN